MNKQKIKLIAFDLDGTLLDDNMKVSEKSKMGLKNIINFDIIIVIISSRSIENICHLITAPVISAVAGLNGSVIYDIKSSRLINKSYLDQNLAKKIIIHLNNRKIIFHIFTEKKNFH